MLDSNGCFLIRIQVSQEAGKMVWHSHIFKNFPQFFVIHRIKGFNAVSEAEVDAFLELLTIRKGKKCPSLGAEETCGEGNSAML